MKTIVQLYVMKFGAIKTQGDLNILEDATLNIDLPDGADTGGQVWIHSMGITFEAQKCIYCLETGVSYLGIAIGFPSKDYKEKLEGFKKAGFKVGDHHIPMFARPKKNKVTTKSNLIV